MIVEGLIDIARRLGVCVIAEGIEAEVQARQLWAVGCEVRGFCLCARGRSRRDSHSDAPTRHRHQGGDAALCRARRDSSRGRTGRDRLASDSGRLRRPAESRGCAAGSRNSVDFRARASRANAIRRSSLPTRGGAILLPGWSGKCADPTAARPRRPHEGPAAHGIFRSFQDRRELSRLGVDDMRPTLRAHACGQDVAQGLSRNMYNGCAEGLRCAAGGGRTEHDGRSQSCRSTEADRAARG